MKASFEAVTDLLQHIRNIVVLKPNIRKYPVLARAVLRPDVFKSKAKNVREASRSPSDVYTSWSQFKEWREAVPYDFTGA